MGELRCKGIMLRNRVEILDEEYGVADALRAGLSTELRDALSYGRIVRGGWYPMAWLREIHEVGSRVTGKGGALARELAAHGAARNFTSVHKAFLTIVSPRAVLKRAPRIFGAYFDGGRFELGSSEPGEARIAISECHGFDRHVWEAMAGTAEAVLTMGGAKDVHSDYTLGPTPASGELKAAWR